MKMNLIIIAMLGMGFAQQAFAQAALAPEALWQPANGEDGHAHAMGINEAHIHDNGSNCCSGCCGNAYDVVIKMAEDGDAVVTNMGGSDIFESNYFQSQPIEIALQPAWVKCSYPDLAPKWDDVNHNSMRGVWADGSYRATSGNSYTSEYEGKLEADVNYTWSCNMDMKGDIVRGFDSTHVSTYMSKDHRAQLTYKCKDPQPHNNNSRDWVCQGLLDGKAFEESVGHLVEQSTQMKHCQIGNYTVKRVDVMSIGFGVKSVDGVLGPVAGLEPRGYPMQKCDLR